MKFLCVAFVGLLLVAASSASLEEQCREGTLPDGYYPHDVYCNKFYTCSLTYWREYTCYGDGLWNAALEGCDYPENVDCGALVSE